MAPPPPPATAPIQLVILDDAPFVRRGAEVHPLASTFHRFAAAVVAAGPFARARYLAPVREPALGDPPPVLEPVDRDRLEVVPTAPFRGAAGYLARLPLMVVRNRPVIDRAIRGAHLVWIRVPTSNALLVDRAARRRDVPRFVYVAGRTGTVVAAQRRRGPAGLAARGLARLHDGIADRLARANPTVVLGRDLFTSTVDAAEVEATLVTAPRATAAVPRIAWAGRIAGEKGLLDLLTAIATLRAEGRSLALDVLGDGPAREAVEAAARELGLGEAVAWHGFIGDRAAYMARLRSSDLFVLPSTSEGVPKVLLDAMAAGLPVIATRVGAVADIVGDDRGWLVPPGDPDALARAVAVALDDPAATSQVRSRALAWVADHTEAAQARRLVAWLQATFPDLPWTGAEASSR